MIASSRVVDSIVKKILILSANPKNTSQLRLDEEVREIQTGLQRALKREQFEIITRWAVRVDDLRRALLDHEPQIVHFSGHGAGSDGLALENNAGELQLVSTKSLARLFKLFKDKVECVLLNACYSEAQAVAIQQNIGISGGSTSKPLRGIAVLSRALPSVRMAKPSLLAVGTTRYGCGISRGSTSKPLRGIAILS